MFEFDWPKYFILFHFYFQPSNSFLITLSTFCFLSITIKLHIADDKFTTFLFGKICHQQTVFYQQFCANSNYAKVLTDD